MSVGLHGYLGLPGSGKTYALKHDVCAAVRQRDTAMVLDHLRDVNWRSVPRDLFDVTATAHSVAEARARAKEGMRLILVRPGDWAIADALEDACAWALRTSSPRVVAVSEIQMACPLMPLQLREHVLRMATQWRHLRGGLYYDTQRPALVNSSLRDMTMEDYNLFALGADDAHNMGKRFGPAMAASLAAITERYARKEKGWHVHLGLVRAAPFPLVRR